MELWWSGEFVALATAKFEMGHGPQAVLRFYHPMINCYDA
jgi:hypothetical protein